jgi:hypothetical protein
MDRKALKKAEISNEKGIGHLKINFPIRQSQKNRRITD